MSDQAQTNRAETVREFYRLLDAGTPPFHLFTADFQFHYPKFGVGHGVGEFVELAMGTRQAISRIAHRIDNLLVASEGSCVAAEGVTEGVDTKGTEWRGGETSGGRFCTVFDFNEDGLIKRMHIHIDPDLYRRAQRGLPLA